jgi:uncharacterized protein (DUF4415 family)
MLFEWDENKEKINISKHGLDFSTAALVFRDQNRLEWFDELHSDYEDRYTRSERSTASPSSSWSCIQSAATPLGLSPRVKPPSKKGECTMVRKEIDVNKPLTDAQIAMLQALADRPDEPDADCPELTEVQLSQFRRVAEQKREERRKQTVTLRLSPQALKKAKSLGKGYTSVLSRILENALDNPEIIHHNL